MLGVGGYQVNLRKLININQRTISPRASNCGSAELRICASGASARKRICIGLHLIGFWSGAGQDLERSRVEQCASAKCDKRQRLGCEKRTTTSFHCVARQGPNILKQFGLTSPNAYIILEHHFLNYLVWAPLTLNARCMPSCRFS